MQGQRSNGPSPPKIAVSSSQRGRGMQLPHRDGLVRLIQSTSNPSIPKSNSMAAAPSAPRRSKPCTRWSIPEERTACCLDDLAAECELERQQQQRLQPQQPAQTRPSLVATMNLQHQRHSLVATLVSGEMSRYSLSSASSSRCLSFQASLSDAVAAEESVMDSYSTALETAQYSVHKVKDSQLCGAAEEDFDHMPTSTSTSTTSSRVLSSIPKPKSTRFGQSATNLIHRVVEKYLPDELDGSVSIARLEAYHQYQANINRLWLCWVLVTTPFPILIVLTAILSIPQQPPDKGWQANWLFFVQVALGFCVVFSGVQVQRPFYLASTIRFSWQQNLGITLCASTLFVVVLIALCAGFGVFPMPFSNVVPIVLVFPVTFAIVTSLFRYRYHSMASAAHMHKSRPPRTDIGARDEAISSVSSEALQRTGFMFAKYRTMSLFNLSLLFIYPIYMVGFRRITGGYQLVYVLLLPMLKELLVHMARKRLEHLHDHVASSTVFSVELMNAMYSTLCMGGAASSGKTSLLIIVMDVAGLGVVFWRLVHKIRVLAFSLAVKNRAIRAPDTSFEQSIEWTLAFVSRHRQSLLNDPSIQLDASNGLSFERRHSISQLFSKQAKTKVAVTNEVHSSVLNPSTAKQEQQHQQQQPQQPQTEQQDNRQAKLNPNCVQLVRDTLAFMFAVEYVLLVEYVEVIIPFMLTVYHTIIFYGPNRSFNHDLASMASHQLHAAMSNMVLYASLELVSLLACALLFQWRFRLNVLSLLGFVLETHYLDIQGKMAFFLTNILSQQFVHFGVDFTFQFEWLHQPRNATGVSELPHA